MPKSHFSDDEFDSALADDAARGTDDNTASQPIGDGTTTPFFVFTGAVISAAPLALYVSMKEMDLAEDSTTPVVAVVTLVSTMALFLSYQATGQEEMDNLMRNRAAKVARAADNKVTLASRQEAAMFSLFYNNASFLALFFLLGFWLLPKLGDLGVALPMEYNYAAAVAGPASILFLKSHKYV